MIKLLLSLVLIAGVPTLAAAQTSPAAPAPAAAAAAPVPIWRTSLKAGINLNESLLSDNWKGGGSSSLGLNALFNYQAHYHEGRQSWDNEVDALYAGQYARGQGYRKTNDRLWLDTKYGYDLNPRWGLFAALNVLSQLGPGFEYPDTGGARLLSGFLAPAYITNSYGMEYHPTTRFRVRIAPFAPRLTVVRDPARFRARPSDVIYGVEAGQSTRWQVLAAQVLAELEQPLGSNAELKARYLFFADYEKFSAQQFNHRLDLTITAKVNRLLSVNFQSTVLYNIDQDASLQFSQGLGLGLLLTRDNPPLPEK